MSIFAAILAIFFYGMIAAMLGTTLPDLSDRFRIPASAVLMVGFNQAIWSALR
jgi:hypothetical protein